MIYTSIRIAAMMVLTALVSGCASLPQSGPQDGAIARNASVTVQNGGGALGFDYALVDLRRDVLPHFQEADAGSLQAIGNSTRMPELRLGVGDQIRVTVFESETGGLFVPSDAGARPGNFVSLPLQEIDINGMITVPYAGSIRAAGNTPSAVEDIIERRLADQAIEPEVAIEIVTKNFSRVTLLGAIGGPGAFELRNSGDRLLDVIARAGGIRPPPHEAVITVTRNGRRATIGYETLVENAQENIFLFPGDSINVTAEPRRFQAFGATGATGEIDFGKTDLTLNEAVAKARGLIDSRADPDSLFVYRLEDAETLNALGVVLPRPETAAAGQDTGMPTIYRVDYRQPDSFFLGQSFQMRPNDVLYVANAGSVNIAKVFDVLNGTTGSVRNLGANIGVVGN